MSEQRDVTALPINGGESPFASLRQDIDRMLSALGLSQEDVDRTLLSDNPGGGHDEEPDQAPQRQLLHRPAEQRGKSSVSRVRSQERRFPSNRRFLPLARVPLVRLAQRAARLRCVALRGGHDWHEFRANGVLVTYYCADCHHEQRRRPKRDRVIGRLA